jgi:predicted permease
MFEKYNAFEMGIGGGGGEYTPQIGFGWSNGVALVMLNSSSINIPSSSDDDGGLSTTNVILLSFGILVAVLLLGGAIYYFLFRSHKESTSLLSDHL